MTQINPLQVKNKLSTQHLPQPLYVQEAKLKSSSLLNCSDPQAIRALIALMDMYAVLGGAASHYGGPAALAELWSALHALVFYRADRAQKKWTDLFHLVNDAGHCENGLYAIKAMYNMAGLQLDSLKKFRSMDSQLTGHGEAHLFPQGVYMSNGPLGSAFPQSQGLALAEKLSGHMRTTICTLSDGAAMEGEAKEALAAIPGLASKGQLGPYLLLITDNNTKLSGRIDQDAFSMKPTFESLQSLGWKVIRLDEGNHLQACVQSIESALDALTENPHQPVAIWAKTIKGIGTAKTEQSTSGGHGFPCKSPTELKAFVSEIYGHQEYPAFINVWIEELIQIENKMKLNASKDTGEKIQKGISKAMIKAAQSGLPILSVTSDLPGSTGVAEFRKEFSQMSIDVGVAESNMISTAAGLSKQGYIPIVDTFAQFGVTKGALPITMAMLSEAPIIGVFSHTGFQDAADGASHQALSYMAMLATIPHVRLYALSSSEEAEQLMYQVIIEFASALKAGDTPPTSIFFLGRENFPQSFSTAKNNIIYKLGEPQILHRHLIGAKNVMLLTAGSMVGEALKASCLLEAQGIGSIVVNMHSINHSHFSVLKSELKKCEGRIVTVEDHQVLLGLGSYVSHQLAQSGEFVIMKSLGVQGEFGQSAYSALELYKKHHMDSDSIVNAAKELLG